MMRRAALVAGVAWREQARQPGLWVATAGVSAVLCGGAGALVLLLGALASSAESSALFAHNLELAGMSGRFGLPALVGVSLATLRFLLVAQLLGTTAVMAAQSLLHERQCGTLPFLLLAPLRRGELILGKALGSLVLPLVVYGVSLGLCALALDLLASAGLALALVLGAPVWAAGVAVVGALLSHGSRDVRGAQQAVWALVLGVTATVGSLLGVDSVVFQGVLLGVGTTVLAGALALGAGIVGREIRR